MSETIPELTNGEFDSFIKEGLVFIDFFAEWCMPCMVMVPIIEDLKEEMEGKVKIGKLDVDSSEEIANKYNISSIPTFILFKDGKSIEQVTGTMTQEDLSTMIKKYL